MAHAPLSPRCEVGPYCKLWVLPSGFSTGYGLRNRASLACACCGCAVWVNSSHFCFFLSSSQPQQLRLPGAPLSPCFRCSTPTNLALAAIGMPPRKKAVVDPAGLLGPAKPASKAKAKAKKNTHSQAAKAAFPPRLDDEESNARAPVPDEEDEAVVASQQPDSSPAAASREGSVDSFALPVTPSVAARRSHLNVGTPAQQLRAKSAVAPVAAPDFASVRRSHEKLVVPMCLRCSKRVYTAKLNLDCRRPNVMTRCKYCSKGHGHCLPVFALPPLRLCLCPT